MAREWIDFRKVKAAVDFQRLFDHYGITGMVNSGDELRGPCPIHKGSPRSKNFSVNMQKNAFKCFASECKAKGNILDFVAAMEHCDVREAALKIAEWFKIVVYRELSGDYGFWVAPPQDFGLADSRFTLVKTL
jgi:DNA primase